MILREFTDSGIETFRKFLATCRDTPTASPPYELLEDDAHTRIVDESIAVEPQSFTIRGDAVRYFRSVLDPLNPQDVAVNQGLWTWLALYYFDQICPPANGQRKVKNDYYYIFEPDSARNYYRHLLYIGWRVSHLAGDYDRLYMNASLAALDGVTTEVMKRLYITRIPCMFEVLDRLYWDDKRGRPRSGILGTGKVKPGDLTNRLPLRIRQLQKTYDLHSLDAEQMIDLLGEEFTGGRPIQQSLATT